MNPSLTLGRGGERLSALAATRTGGRFAYRDGDGRRFTEIANYRPENQEDDAVLDRHGLGPRRLGARGRPPDRPRLHPPGLGAVLYPYLMMDALWDDTNRANLRYEATGLGGRQASVRVQGYFTQVDHWMTDERRTSSLAKPRDYSMGTRAETRTAGGKAEAVLGGLTLGVEGYERQMGCHERDGGIGLRAAGHDPRGLGAGGRRLRRVHALARARAGALGRGSPRRRAQRGGPGRANVALYEAYQGTRSLSASDTLPAAKVRLAWRRGAWEIAGGVGHAARVPEATERYLALRRMGTDWVGNPDLVPSRNTGLDAAVGFTRAGFRLDLGLYASHVSDYVTVYDQARRAMLPGVMNAMARSFANVDATLTGAELGGSLPIVFGRVFVSGDVSYVRGRQDGDPSRGIAAGPLAEMPPLRGRVAARYDDGRFFGSVEGVFAADQDRVDASLNEARTPGWGVLNASLGVRQGRLRLTAGVANFFDRLYTDHLSYQRDPFRSGVRVPEPGRSLFANASFRF